MKMQALLRSCRLKKNFTVRQMAAHLKVDPAQWSKWETGAVEPRLLTVISMAPDLDCSRQEIINAFIEDTTIKQKTAL